MGKIRVNTIGDESLEQKQKIDAKKRKEAKKAEKKSDVIASEARPESDSPQKKTDAGQASMTKREEPKKKVPASAKASARQAKKITKQKLRSPRYTASKKIIEKSKQYNISQALNLLSQMQAAKFDETVEIHINTIETGVSGTISLPHGTGKKTKVVIISPAKDPKAADELLKKIESGKIEFDVLIATPDAMPKLAKVARILGPKGLMPNPKAGTVTPKPEELAKKYEAGQIAYKTEVKSPIIHVMVGKMSFGKDKLAENIEFLLSSMDRTKLKSAFVKSTMSPSVKLVI